MGTQLVSLSSPALLGLFREALDSALVERGAEQIVELLGPENDFWTARSDLELRRMADGGNAPAQAELAWRLAIGVDGAKSPAQALRWASLSAERACPAGYAVLGWLLYQGVGLPVDQVEAARLFRLAAEAGDVRGATWLGLCLLRGHGLEKQLQPAVYWFDYAATRGAGLAQFCLGRAHYFGLPGVLERDHDAAFKWLNLAVTRHQPRAKELLARCYFFGRGVGVDHEQAVRLWRDAAEDGVVSACYCIGMCLYMGVGGASDPAAAVRYFRAAARKSQPGAMFLLGQCYTFGQGVTQDVEAGLAWYRRASARGNRDADFELGECFAHGAPGVDGVPDMSQALRWWRLGARRGHGRAQIKVGHCYRWGDGVGQNPALALAWYRRALDSSEISAAVWVGECLEHGEGVSVDLVGAMRMYRQAAEAGDAHGMAELGRCLLHGIGCRKHRQQGESWLRKAAEAGWETAMGELERLWFSQAERLLSRESGDGSDTLTAIQLYARAAALGHQPSALRYAQALRHGRGIARDARAALQWFSKASHLLDAKLALADMLFFGEAGEVRQEEAFRWYLLAAEQGEDAYAMYSAGFCLLRGVGTVADVAAGTNWLEEAARRGDAEAQYELGRFCIETDAPRARCWLESAAALGHAGAERLLARMTTDDLTSDDAGQGRRDG